VGVFRNDERIRVRSTPFLSYTTRRLSSDPETVSVTEDCTCTAQIIACNNADRPRVHCPYSVETPSARKSWWFRAEVESGSHAPARLPVPPENRVWLPKTSSTAKSLRSGRGRARVVGPAEPSTLVALRRACVLHDAAPVGHPRARPARRAVATWPRVTTPARHKDGRVNRDQHCRCQRGGGRFAPRGQLGGRARRDRLDRCRRRSRF
jgi:hypothetical protein